MLSPDKRLATVPLLPASQCVGKGVVLDGEESSKHEYCLLALEHLLERADAYSLNSEPVRWGWCRSAHLPLCMSTLLSIQ